ncbi:MAG: hypothetical protein ACPGVG_11490, partial [Mycobacterium sp.]
LVPPSSASAVVNNPVPPTVLVPPSSVAANTGTAQLPIPGTSGSSLAVSDLLTPPGVLRAVQDGVSSVTGALPPPPVPVPGAAAAADAGVPAAANQLTPLAATGLSNLVSPPALNVPSIPGLPVPLPNEVPVPSDLICVDTDWSASQGDPAGPAINADVPMELVNEPTGSGTQHLGQRRDRWDSP